MAKKKTEKPLPTITERRNLLSMVASLREARFRVVGSLGNWIRLVSDEDPSGHLKVKTAQQGRKLVAALNKAIDPITSKIADELEAEALRR